MKSVEDLTDREKRLKRQRETERKRDYRRRIKQKENDQKRGLENSDNDTPNENPTPVKKQRKVNRKRRKCYEENTLLRGKNKNLELSVSALKKKVYRLEKKNSTKPFTGSPKSVVRRLLKNKKTIDTDIEEQLVFKLTLYLLMLFILQVSNVSYNFRFLEKHCDKN